MCNRRKGRQRVCALSLAASAVVALSRDPKPSAGELTTRSPPSAALQQLAAACLCCYGDVRIFFTYYNCCWILQVAASKRRAAYLSMDRARSTARNLTGHGGGRLHAAFLPARALCAVCCVMLVEIPGVSNAKAFRFWFCFYVQIRIA